MKTFAALLLGLAVLLFPDRAEAQSPDRWWSWVLPEVRGAQIRHYHGHDYDESAPDTERRKRRPRLERGGHIPPGHLPPPGECRLWYHDRPPGQQPPPVPCGNLVTRRYPGATVVGHHGVVKRRHWPRPRARPIRSGRTGWEVVVWGEIVFRRGARHVDGEIVGSAVIEGVLGRSVVDRLRRHRPRGEAGADLRGRWIGVGRRGRALQVRAGGAPVAELSDVDGDGRVDTVLLSAGGS